MDLEAASTVRSPNVKDVGTGSFRGASADNVKARIEKESHRPKITGRPESDSEKKLSTAKGLRPRAQPPTCYVFLHLPFPPRLNDFHLVTWFADNGIVDAAGGRPGRDHRQFVGPAASAL